VTDAYSIDPATSLGTVVLTVADLDMQAAFYRDAIGLRQISREGGTVELGVADSDAPLVTLVGSPDAPPRPPGTTGLFHVALLVPSRPDLARAIRRVTDAGHRFTGAADHLVSEALYLDDPEGNGIEIYRDRPRAEWSYDGAELQMATLPLDVEGVLASGTDTVASGVVPHGTTIGHVHLQVADLDEAEAFYVGTLGFSLSVRRTPGALFVAAGGYPHHVGLNTWAGRGVPSPPAGARGLSHFTVVIPDERSLAETRNALGQSGRELLASEGEATVVADPSGNRLVVTAP
jgi:catechol 2,3-dioxygenase